MATRVRTAPGILKVIHRRDPRDSRIPRCSIGRGEPWRSHAALRSWRIPNINLTDLPSLGRRRRVQRGAGGTTLRLSAPMRHPRGSPRASSSGMPSGIRTELVLARRRTGHGGPNRPVTRSPGRTRVTPGPISRTMPTGSCPIPSGRFFAGWSSRYRSEAQTPDVRTSTSASPGPGLGSGHSTVST